MITYCLTVFPLTPNTWLWLTLNPDFVLNCVLRQHVWSLSVAAFEAWLSYTCSECCWRTSTEKNTCGIARFPCGSTAFLLPIGAYEVIKYTLSKKTPGEVQGRSQQGHQFSARGTRVQCPRWKGWILGLKGMSLRTLPKGVGLGGGNAMAWCTLHC